MALALSDLAMPANPVCTVWNYKNSAYPRLVATLYEFQGQLNYSSFGYETGWHGQWKKEMCCNLVKLQFHHGGNLAKLRPVRVFKITSDLYQGMDYRQRVITLERIAEWEYNGQVWQ